MMDGFLMTMSFCIMWQLFVAPVAVVAIVLLSCQLREILVFQHYTVNFCIFFFFNFWYFRYYDMEYMIKHFMPVRLNFTCVDIFNPLATKVTSISIIYGLARQIFSCKQINCYSIYVNIYDLIKIIIFISFLYILFGIFSSILLRCIIAHFFVGNKSNVNKSFKCLKIPFA